MSSTMQETVQKASVAVRENRLPEAMNDLQNVLAQTPEDFAANHLLGVALLKSKRLPEAIARLLKATQLKPDHAAARAHLGMAYAAAGKAEMARAAYEAALKIDPAFAMAQSGLAKLPSPAAPAKKAVAAPVAADVPPPPPMPAPPVKTPTAPKVKDFTAPGAVKAKPKPKEGFLKKALGGADSSDVALLIIGVIIIGAGAYVVFYFSIKVGIAIIVLGGSALKAGQPGREHWRDDF